MPFLLYEKYDEDDGLELIERNKTFTFGGHKNGVLPRYLDSKGILKKARGRAASHKGAYFGRYVYITVSQRAACNLLTQEHAHLTDALRAPLKEALQGLWVYFSSLTGHTPCTREIAYGWPDCLEKPEST